MRFTMILVAVAALDYCSQIAAAATIDPAAFDSAALAAAIRKAMPGDTVRLASGAYELAEPIRPKSGIKLLGAGQEKTPLVYKGPRPGFSSTSWVRGRGDRPHDARRPEQSAGPAGHRRRQLPAAMAPSPDHPQLQGQDLGAARILFSGHNPTMEGGVTDSRISDCLIEDIGLEVEWGGGIRLAWGSVRNQVVGNVIRNTGRGGIFGDQSAELIDPQQPRERLRRRGAGDRDLGRLPAVADRGQRASTIG